MGCESQGPIEMQKNWSMKPGNQWEGREVCQKRNFVTWHGLEEADVMASSFGE